MRASRIVRSPLHAPGGAWTPLLWAADIAAWYHADDLTAAPGASFQTWPSRAGGPTAYQNSGSARFIVGALSTGARAAAVSTGSQWMKIDGTLISAPACSILAVFQYSTLVTAKTMLVSVGGGALTGGLHLGSGTPDGRRQIFIGVNGGLTLFDASHPSYNPATPGLASYQITTDPQQWVLTADSTASGAAAWIGGRAMTVGAGPQAIGVGTAPSALGAQPYTGSGYYMTPCKLREVLILRRKVTAQDVAQWTTYVTMTSGV